MKSQYHVRFKMIIYFNSERIEKRKVLVFMFVTKNHIRRTYYMFTHFPLANYIYKVTMFEKLFFDILNSFFTRKKKLPKSMLKMGFC